MTIVNNKQKELLGAISYWIKEKVHGMGKQHVIIAAQNNLNCCLTSLLCRRAGIEYTCIPRLGDVGINRTFSDFEEFSQTEQIKYDCNLFQEKYKALESVEGLFQNKNYLYNALVKEFAETKEALIIGAFDREEIIIDKPWQAGIFDLMPLGDLYKSELVEMAIEEQSFALPRKPTNKEWLLREEDRVGILSKQEDPSKNRYWPGYTGQQKKIIGKEHSLYKKNIHKLGAQVLTLRNQGFVI